MCRVCPANLGFLARLVPPALMDPPDPLERDRQGLPDPPVPLDQRVVLEALGPRVPALVPGPPDPLARPVPPGLLGPLDQLEPPAKTEAPVRPAPQVRLDQPVLLGLQALLWGIVIFYPPMTPPPQMVT